VIATALIFHRNFAEQNMLTHFLENIAATGG
jgi:hypothetical protein